MQPTKTFKILWALTLLAFALAVYQLDGQSLRGDEAFDAVFITRPFSSMIDEMRISQPYPPMYHVALKGWTAIAGNSVFALRFPSVLCAVLVVPLTYRLGRLWFGKRAGYTAALLAAFHPLLLWYAQDRVYAPLIMLVLGSTVLATLLWQGYTGKLVWIGYAALTLLSLGEHYAALFPILTQNLIAVIWGWRSRGKRWLGTWIIVQILIGLLYLPWIAFAWPVLTSHTSNWASPVTLADMLARLFQAYSVGLTIQTGPAFIPLIGFGLALLLGLFSGESQSDRPVRLMALALIIIPVAGVFALSQSRPMFDERYLVTIIPPYLALLGRGLISSRRRIVIGAAGLMLSGMFIATVNYRFDPAFVKAPNWNAVFAYLRTHARSEDAIVFTFPDPAPEYYAQGRWPVFLVPSQAPPDSDTVRQIASGIAAAHPRIWLIPQWSRSWDEHRLTEQTLDTLAERAAEPAVGGFHLVLYHTRSLYEAERTPLSATLGDDIHLIGFTLRQPDGAATHRLRVHPVDTIRLALYWRADQKPETDYSVFVHLLDEAGQVQSQQDNWPRAGAYPTSWWSPGEIVVDTYVLPVRPDTLPGSYTLVTGMYDSTGARLKTTGDQADAGNSRISLPVEIDIQSP